ncbi:MAG TPA: cadmium resistance transporter [Coleofasciculaceae cyanobacterium]
MSWLTQAIAAGITSFIATNLDDIVILMLFFGQLSPSFRVRQIVFGQYLGFAVLVLASLPGFFGGLLVPEAWIGLLGILPIAIGLFKLRHPESEEVQAVSEEMSHPKQAGAFGSLLSSVLSPQAYGVAAVTVANGGDNLGIYVPLFAASDALSLVVILGVFFLMIGLWCYLAWQLASHPVIARLLTRYGERLVPWVLIGLGIFILVENGSYRLLPFFQS